MAMMREELVVRERLVSEKRYLEGLGVVKLLPGPVSTLLSVFLGQEVSGYLGGLLSALCFILPSFLMILCLVYFQSSLSPDFLETPTVASAMKAVQIAVLAIILGTCWKLFSESYKRKYAEQNRKMLVLACAALALGLSLLNLPELFVLGLSSVAGLGALSWAAKAKAKRLNIDLFSLFMIFFTAGLTVFGTGYMVLPYLERVLVAQNQLLSSKDFLDAVVFGNFTPGPVVIATTYMGYKIAGINGALVSTAGIFGGPILLMLVLGPWVRKVLDRPWVEGLLVGLLPAVAVSIALSVIPFAKSLNPMWAHAVVFMGACWLVFRWRLAAWLVLIICGLVGAMLPLLGIF